ncbi:PDR/VanB family oxidoreductase [Cupriavidus numazuensis]|uniref:Phthalate dioxygenase reductase n=1 Tax=Cupriavidus numazuensis TaxID=221992 RepID=A0ABN7Q0J9_9BURK|nr:PDR/VanB family oxidoreductase [Cupriavidus numazuensis]CAG2145248.1 Phthalate dioxygenase reductase [Cupriavidus numazuensis]
MRLRISDIRQETASIRAFELVDPYGTNLPPFTPGAHVDVLTPAGLTRQYSLCNGPNECHRYVIGVLDAPDSRGGSRSLHAHAKVGDELEVSVPRNHFPLDASATSSLLLAGGIGITPMLGMAEHLARGGASFALHYCVRTENAAAFRERLMQADLAGSVSIHADDGPAAQRLSLDALLSSPDGGTHLYVCGPAGLIDAAFAAARRNGWPESRLHREYFGAIPDVRTGNAAFDIELGRSGVRIRVESDQSALDAMTAAGIDVPHSCEQGVCGTCLTRVISGIPDHRDAFLGDGERADNDCFLPCCSRSLSPLLVLDL